EAAAVTDAGAERLDAAVVQLDEPAYDRQSQPEAFGRPARRGALDQRFEHAAEQLGRHPGTAVVDAQHDLLALRHGAYHEAAAGGVRSSWEKTATNSSFLRQAASAATRAARSRVSASSRSWSGLRRSRSARALAIPANGFARTAPWTTAKGCERRTSSSTVG